MAQFQTFDMPAHAVFARIESKKAAMCIDFPECGEEIDAAISSARQKIETFLKEECAASAFLLLADGTSLGLADRSGAEIIPERIVWEVTYQLHLARMRMEQALGLHQPTNMLTMLETMIANRCRKEG